MNDSIANYISWKHSTYSPGTILQPKANENENYEFYRGKT